VGVFTDLYNDIDMFVVFVVIDVFVVWPSGPDRGPPEHRGATEKGAEETQGPGGQPTDGA